ncbi:MAG: polysaccharide deacetylase family protein [Anaerolineae bacterium]|nr:polysaccharide deacetylase family protein [Anaerolineae bacterium]
MKSVLFSIRSKGLFKYFKRGQSIIKSYGLTPAQMVQALDQFSQILQEFQCGATFPITGIVVERNGQLLKKYLEQGIEFAIHGYRHIDYAQLTLEEQVAYLGRARDVFTTAGILATGFRSPYLRCNESLRLAIKKTDLTYVSNQPILWNVLDDEPFSLAEHTAYERAIAFYTPWYAYEQLSLPHLNDQIVEIPVSLPDDEILLDRLGDETGHLVQKAWRRILSESYQRGELFTMQLHPERIARCAEGLSAVLAEARALTPSVWIARLAEIAAWWQARRETTIEITNTDDGGIHLVVAGPSNTTVLARAVQVDAPTVPWVNGYQRVLATTFTIRSHRRPFIGISPDASPKLADFLGQQGFIVEVNRVNHHYSYYVDQAEFDAEYKQSLLGQLEKSEYPCVRLGRWPDGARSALAITGDIDALTLWDYGLRLLGR